MTVDARQRGARPPLMLMALLAGCLLLLPLTANVPFVSSQGQSLRWFGGGQDISFVIQATGSDDVADASDDLAIRLAFDQWASVAGATVSFVEDTSAASRARTDWEANNIHLVLFDETNDTGFFPDGSSTLAITPVSFNPSTGRILDADILYNGAVISGGDPLPFGTDPAQGGADIWGVATHEVGHLLGFDHNGFGGSTLNPAIEEGAINPRRLHGDDRAGLAIVYPSAPSTLGSISGAVTRGGLGIVGANVWARRSDDGRVVSQTLTDAQGNYTLRALETGSYLVVTAPLNKPTQTTDFSLPGIDPDDIDIDFTVNEVGPVSVTGSGTATAPTLVVGTAVASTLNSAFPRTPMTVHAGDTRPFHVVLEGTTTGVSASVPDAGPLVTASLGGFGPVFTLSATAAADAAPGLYDVLVMAPSGSDYYPGFLEVLPAAPTLTALITEVGSTNGGASVTLAGSDLGNDPIVIFGDVFATDVALSKNGEFLFVTAPPREAAGTVDVIVVNDEGDEARLADSFTYVAVAQPEILSAYPTVASADGGTPVRLLGTGFDPSATVTVAAFPAASVTFVSDTRIDITLPALAPGNYGVTVTNPGPLLGYLNGGISTTPLPDPSLLAVAPDIVSSGGGDDIVISGSGFLKGVQVLFGASLDDGSGGELGGVSYDSANQLTVTTPALAPGDMSLLVINPGGQIAAQEGALEVAPVLLGKDKFLGDITAGDTDTAMLQGLPGTTLSIKVRRDKGDDLVPKIVVRDPAGTAIASTDPGDAAYDADLVRAKGRNTLIRKLLLEDLGRYMVEISSQDGSTGGYTLSMKERLSPDVRRVKLRKQDAIAVTGAAPHEITLLAKSGSVLSGKISSRDGVLPQVEAFVGPDGSIAPAVAERIVTSKSGKAIKFKKLPLEAFGAFLLSIGTDGEDGTITGSLKIRPPKSKVKYEE